MQALAAENLKFQKQLAKYKPENQEEISRKNSRVGFTFTHSFLAAATLIRFSVQRGFLKMISTCQVH